MITNEIFKRPIISFGLGVTEKTISLGDTVRIWQNEIYNGDEYSLVYDDDPYPVYGFELTPSSTGTLNIACRISGNSGKVFILSNTITLTIV